MFKNSPYDSPIQPNSTRMSIVDGQEMAKSFLAQTEVSTERFAYQPENHKTRKYAQQSAHMVREMSNLLLSWLSQSQIIDDWPTN